MQDKQSNARKARREAQAPTTPTGESAQTGPRCHPGKGQDSLRTLEQACRRVRRNRRVFFPHNVR